MHALLGENGAGKSTLVRIFGGMLDPDGGTLELAGAEHPFPSSAREAARLGIGMVHQHFTLVPRLSVLENVALGVRTAAGGLRLPRAEVRSRIRELADTVGFEADPEASVEELGVGDRQRVEILKALYRDPKILVLDEPTAVLAPTEVEGLFDTLRRFAAEGRAVLLIAHKLDEVLAVADRVTVLRSGTTVLEAARTEVDADRLARAMVGRTVETARNPGEEPETGEVVAELCEVVARGARGERALRGVDLTVRRGEIVGIAGVEGNGQRELARLLAGRLEEEEGRRQIPHRVGFIPQDRRREGLVLDFDLAENLALALGREPEFRRGPLIRWKPIRARAVELVQKFDVRTPGVETPVRALSGGNQQKVVVAREFERAGDLLVAENPTRGLDVSAAEFVHRSLLELRDRGAGGPGVVLISTDLDEVLALADRILVQVRGRLREVPEERRSREGIGGLMLAGDGDVG